MAYFLSHQFSKVVTLTDHPLDEYRCVQDEVLLHVLALETAGTYVVEAWGVSHPLHDLFIFSSEGLLLLIPFPFTAAGVSV